VDFGKRLKSARTAKGYTQAELARRAGVSQGVITHYERGVNRPRLDQALALVQALGMSFDDFFLSSKPPKGETGSDRVHGNSRTSQILELFDHLSSGDQRTVLKFVRNLAKSP
jgi:transcriptional regulator with XRE-family HTH domain